MPALLARMKQGHDAIGTPSFWVRGGNVGPLFQVAAQATEAEIGLLIGPHMLLGDNMINLMWQQGGALRQATIFAGVLRTLLYPRSEEHTSELQSQSNLVCRLLLEKKK